MLDAAKTAAYLERIGVDQPDRLDATVLRQLHERHVLSVPFETVDYHLGREINCKDEGVVDKIIYEHRGGGCGEINLGFYFLLQALGFTTRLLHGRVWFGSRLYAPYNHVVSTVDLDGSRWIADVGFGKISRYPLLWNPGVPQQDPHGEFLIRKEDDRTIDVLRNGKPQYRLYDEEVDLSTDLDQVVWWFRTSPDSPFLQNLICSRPLDNGWVTLKDDVLTVSTGEEKTSDKLADDAEVLAAYEKWFGIRLEKRPTPSPHMRSNPARVMAVEQE